MQMTPSPSGLAKEKLEDETGTTNDEHMRIDAQFSIYRSRRNWGAILSAEAFRQALEYAVSNKFTDQTYSDCSDFCGIIADSNAPALKHLLALLEGQGWTAHYGYVPAGSTSRFSVRLLRRYETEDFDNARYLQLGGTWGGMPLTGFVARDGERWIGDVDRVGAHSGLGWTQQIGSIDGTYNYFVSDQVRDALQAQGLRGLHFHPLKWNDPARAKASFWEVDTSVTMPPCLLPVVDVDGQLDYEDGGYSPPELQFDAKAVQTLGEFDFAWCRETIGDLSKSNWGRKALVVSQRARQVLADLGFSDLVRYMPVLLL